MTGPLDRVPVPDLTPSDPLAICSWGGSRRDAFAATSSGLWHSWSDDGLSYARPECFSAPWVGGARGIAACSRAQGTLDVFGVDGNGSVHRARFTPANGWVGWDDFGGGLDPTAALGAASRGKGLIDVFGVGVDRRLRQLQRQGGRWSAWGVFDDAAVRDGVGVAGARGRLLLTSMSGGVFRLAMVRSFDPTAGWSSWQTVFGSNAAPFTATGLPSAALTQSFFQIVGKPSAPRPFLLAPSSRGQIQAVSDEPGVWRVATVSAVTSLTRPALVGGDDVDALVSVTYPKPGDQSLARARVVRIESAQVVSAIDIPVR